MKLIYVYRHKKRRKDGTYYKLNNSYGRYCDKEAIIAEAQKYSDTVESEDFCEKLDRRAIMLRYNAYCEGAKKYINNSATVITLCRECVAYNKSLKSKPVEGCYDGEYKQGEPLDLSVFPDEMRNQVDDNWGEPIDFTIEEILDMPVMGEESRNNFITPKQDTIPSQIDDMNVYEFQGRKTDCELFCIMEKDLDYIDIDDLY